MVHTVWKLQKFTLAQKFRESMISAENHENYEDSSDTQNKNGFDAETLSLEEFDDYATIFRQ